MALAIAVPSAAGDVPSHPAQIHEGLCSAPGPALQPLTDVTTAAAAADDPDTDQAPPVGAASAVPVAASITKVPLSLSDLVAADHSIVIRAGDADPAAILVCGDIGGRTLEGTDLALGLVPVDASDYAGVAWLSDNEDGSTLVRLALLQLEPGAGPTAPSPSPVPAPEIVELDDRVWFAGLEILLRTATHDRVSDTVEVTGAFSNTGTGASDLDRLPATGAIAIEWEGARYEGVFANGGTVAGEATVEDVIRVSVPDALVLADATLVLGGPAQHQATIPLADRGRATSTFPDAFRVSGEAVNQGVVTVTALDGWVVPATCDGTPDALSFGPADADRVSLVLRVREAARRTGATVTSFATGPDGVRAPGTPGGSATLSSRQTIEGARYCYTFPAPITGPYRITIESRTAGREAVRRSFTIEVP